MKIIQLDKEISNWPPSAIVVLLGVMTIPTEGLCAKHGLDSVIQLYAISSGTIGGYVTKTS